MLRKEHSGAYRDAMRYGGHEPEVAEKALLIGRMLDESAMAMLTKFEEVVKKDRAQQRQLDGGAVDHSDGGAAVQIEGGAAAQIEGGDSRFGLSVRGAPVAPILEKRRSSREMKRPADTTSWQSKTWEQTVQKIHSMKVGAGEEMRSEVSKVELLREHWIRNVLHVGDLIVAFIPGEMNAANVGTKS
jgi:hypothetical protein